MAVTEPAQQLAETVREQWGRNVLARRHEAGLTQAALAERAGVGQGTVAKIEQGRAWPSDLLKVKIAWALGSRPGQLWNWDRS